MHIGDIYKSLTDNHFIVIQSYGTMINKEEINSDDLLVIAYPLMVVDNFVASDPVRAIIGKQEEIEDKYVGYLRNEINTGIAEYNKILEGDIKPKIEEQEKIDMKEVEEMLSEVDADKFKEDISKILKGEGKED